MTGMARRLTTLERTIETRPSTPPQVRSFLRTISDADLDCCLRLAEHANRFGSLNGCDGSDLARLDQLQAAFDEFAAA